VYEPFVFGALIGCAIAVILRTWAYPRGERRWHLTVLTLEHISIFLAALTIIWWVAHWGEPRLLVYSLLLAIPLIIVTEAIKHAWLRWLRLRNHVSPPSGWLSVPRGQIMVRVHHQKEVGKDWPKGLVVGTTDEGDLYPLDPSNYYTEWFFLEDGQTYDFVGRRSGRSRQPMRPCRIINQRGRAQFVVQ